MKNFIDFVRTQGIIGFAVGFILGRAMSDLVGSFVNDIINPLIGVVIYRYSDLTELSWNIGSSSISYGKFISLIINFLILAAVVYVIFKKFHLEKLDKPKEVK